MLWLMLAVASLFRMATMGRMLESNDPPPGNGKPKPSEILEQYSGNATRMAEKLADALGDNFKLREQKRTLADENERLKGNQKPEGATILTGDEATAYEAYRALGKPDEVQQRLQERETLQGQLSTLQRDAVLRDAAQVAGYKFSVLRDRAGDLAIEVRDATEEGKAVKRAFVKTQAGETPLAEYAAREWADYLPALQAGDAGRQAGAGVQFPGQAGGNPPPANPVQTYIQGAGYAPPKRQTA